METKFNFNSQVSTTIEQSRKLLALGLKKETADMWFYKDSFGWRCSPFEEIWDEKAYLEYGTPAWSLSRLLCMLPDRVYEKKYWHDGRTYDNILEPEIDFVFGLRYKGTEGNHEFYDNSNLYESVVQCIEWLIKEGYFNKEYLV